MAQIAIGSSDGRLEELLRRSGLQLARVEPGDWAAVSGASAPAVLVLDVRRDPHVPPALGAYRRHHPGVAVVLVTTALDPRLMLDAMRAGVAECVAEPITSSALEAAVRRVMVGGHDEAIGQVFAFIGAKGGVGTTTLAVNTAATLAQAAGAKVLLADLHAAHGDAAVFLGVEPRFSVADALEHGARLDDELFRSLVTRTKPGVDLLASSDRMPHAALNAQDSRALLEFVTQRYRYTVLDVPRSDVWLLDALDLVTTTVIVSSQEVGSLRNAARIAQTLTQRHGASRVRVAVNRFNHGADIDESDLERVLGGAVSDLLPSDYRNAVEALNTGSPVVLQKEQRLSRALRRFATSLAGIVKDQPERPAGLLGRLAFRRA